jgi:hypothetical protein
MLMPTGNARKKRELADDVTKGEDFSAAIGERQSSTSCAQARGH